MSPNRRCSSRRSVLFRHRLRPVWRIVLGCAPARKSQKINMLRCWTSAGCGREHRALRTRPLFDMGKAATASCLVNKTAPCLLNKLSALRITEELVDSKVLLRGAYSADQRSAVRWIGDHTPNHWSDGASLTVVLLLSPGSG